MRAVAVQPDDVERWKVPLSWHFSSFTADGSITSESLWADLAEMRRQLWVLEDDTRIFVAVLTSITEDQFKTCDVTHAAGVQRKKWQHLWPALEHWAREIGCKRIRAIARPGWERLLPLKKTHVVLEGFL